MQVPVWGPDSVYLSSATAKRDNVRIVSLPPCEMLQRGVVATGHGDFYACNKIGCRESAAADGSARMDKSGAGKDAGDYLASYP